jgi:hypothetical protein
MSKVLDTAYGDIQRDLENLYGKYVTAHDLAGHLPQIARALHVPPPEKRDREVSLAWLAAHAPASMQIYRGLYQQTHVDSF